MDVHTLQETGLWSSYCCPRCWKPVMIFDSPTLGVYCSSMWDGLLCWEESPAGTYLTKNCPASPDMDPTGRTDRIHWILAWKPRKTWNVCMCPLPLLLASCKLQVGNWNEGDGMRVCVFACVSECVCVRVHACACVHCVCVQAYI